MKKVIGTIMCMSLILGNAMFANASKTGDVVAYTVYTDIIASINDYNIESYNINGYSAVVAEELRNYGFYVEWNEKEGPLGYLYGKEMTAPLPKTLQDICDGLFGRSE